jgi:plastocyanin
MDVSSRQDRDPRTAPTLLTRVGALALAAGLLAACGGDSGTPEPAGGAPTSATAAATDDASTSSATSSAMASATEEDEAAAEEVVITIEDFGYELPDSVPAGAEILVRNLDSVGHTVTADEGETFDVVVGPGEEVTFAAPEQAGDYPFHCTPHPAMTATLVVEGDGS